MRVNYVLTLASALLVTLSASSYAADPHWTYDEQTTWGALESNDITLLPPALYPYSLCGIGQKQSPIALSAPTAKNLLNALKPSYSPMPLSVSNNGHTIKVNAPTDANPNALHIGKESYPLLQFHFHAPSEHTLNGKSFPLEMHLVHATASGKIAVLGVFFRQGPANAEFQKILDNAPLSSSLTNTSNDSLDPNYLLPRNKQFINYAGSLTTPPCTEGVEWYVLRYSITVSAAQIAQFSALYADNNRQPQPLFGRAPASM